MCNPRAVTLPNDSAPTIGAAGANETPPLESRCAPEFACPAERPACPGRQEDGWHKCPGCGEPVTLVRGCPDCPASDHHRDCACPRCEELAPIARRARTVMEAMVHRAREEWHDALRPAHWALADASRRIARRCIADARAVRFALTGHYGSVAYTRSQDRRSLRGRSHD